MKRRLLTILFLTFFSIACQIFYSTSVTALGTTSQNSASFLANEFDEATGLYYFGARYLDPETGLFTGVDPIKGDFHDPRTLVPYTYAFHNPTAYVDPDGEFAWVPLIFIAAYWVGTGIAAV